MILLNYKVLLADWIEFQLRPSQCADLVLNAAAGKRGRGYDNITLGKFILTAHTTEMDGKDPGKLRKQFCRYLRYSTRSQKILQIIIS